CVPLWNIVRKTLSPCYDAGKLCRAIIADPSVLRPEIYEIVGYVERGLIFAQSFTMIALVEPAGLRTTSEHPHRRGLIIDKAFVSETLERCTALSANALTFGVPS